MAHRRLATALAVALLAVAPLAACSSRGPAPDDEGRPAPARARSLSVLTPDEVRAGNYDNAYTAILALRPTWLQPQGGRTGYTGPGATPFVGVVREGNRSNLGLDYLRTLRPQHFVEIRRVNPPQATNRYGMTYQWGVIEVVEAQ